MAKRKLTFSVYANIRVVAGLTIHAVDLEDAIAQARDLSVTDFVSFTEDFVDGEPVHITGVSEIE